MFGADHVPARDFLVRTLGYLRDARVGFVATRTESCHLDAFPCRPLSGMRARRAPRPARDRLLQ
ncbi:hypothetical protein RZS08_62935, partial [Arthrospira platensis SPKY1]|nr:hypothetical protein [Arthrospira platensis SPKY1]